MISEKSNLIKEDFNIFLSNYKLRARWLRHRKNARDTRPVLVFLHEALGCIEMWHEFPEQIAAMTGCDALIYDRLGHGKSSPLPSSSLNSDYLYTEAWESLPAVLSHCGIKRSVFIGHSDGGTIALLFSSKYPESAGGIITEAAHVFVDDLTVKGIKKAVNAYNTSNLKDKLSKYHSSNVEPMFLRWVNIWLSSEFADWNITGNLNKINCPVLVVQGEDDEYGTVNQMKTIAGKVGGYSEELLIPDCGHIPHSQARDIFSKKLIEFIEHCQCMQLQE